MNSPAGPDFGAKIAIDPPRAGSDPTNTEYERLALGGSINLSDGHARQSAVADQAALILESVRWLEHVHQRPQPDIERDFIDAFFQCGKQSVEGNAPGIFLSYSSSCAIKIAAQYCRLKKLTVHLIEPCFDNIRHMLLTEGVTVCSLREHILNDIGNAAKCFGRDQAIWLVLPNNPTGFCLDEQPFRKLIACAAAAGVTMIVDFCFRFFSPSLGKWDQYLAFRDAGLNFITIEDTGKTWSLADTKTGIMVCSRSCTPTIHRLHDELLLNVSPYQLMLLTAMIRRTVELGFYKTVGVAVETNRMLVHRLVEKGLLVRASNDCGNVPMEFLELPNKIPATEFWSLLRSQGVDVLPAHNYYWSQPAEGGSRFRIPLARPTRDFEIAIPILEKALHEIANR